MKLLSIDVRMDNVIRYFFGPDIFHKSRVSGNTTNFTQEHREMDKNALKVLKNQHKKCNFRDNNLLILLKHIFPASKIPAEFFLQQNPATIVTDYCSKDH